MSSVKRQSGENQFTKAKIEVKSANKRQEPVKEAEKETTDKLIAEPDINKVEPDKNTIQTKPVKERSKKDDLSTKLFAMKHKGRGVARSVYFEAEVFDKLENISKKYELNLSETINTILKDALENF